MSLKRNEKIWMYGTFFLYVILMGFSILRHEPWSDEAQAWLLARDASLPDLIFRYLRYEGSPGLWHLVLMLPAKLHLPYVTLQIIAGCFAAFGVFVFLRFAPFPKFVKTILPFSYFVLYQYAVVARAYVMFPAFFFLLATLFPYRKKYPFRFLGLILLMASTSLHGTVAAIGLVMAYFWDVFRSWPTLTLSERKRYRLVASVFFAYLVIIVMVLWTPKDYYGKMIRLTPFEFLTRTLIIYSDVLITNALFLKDYSLWEVVFNSVGLLFWYVTFRFVGEKNLLKYLFFPMIGLSLLFGVNFLNPWHTGIVFFLWIFAIWISFNDSDDVKKHPEDSRKIIIGVLCVVLAAQICWSIQTLGFDWFQNYSGGKEIACYIKNHHLEDEVIYSDQLYSSAILAYFNRNFIANNPDRSRSFTIWTEKETNYKLHLKLILEKQPNYIVVRCRKVCGNYWVEPFLNYRFVRIFNGGMFWKTRIHTTETYVLYKKSYQASSEKWTRAELERAAKALTIDYHPELLLHNKHRPIENLKYSL